MKNRHGVEYHFEEIQPGIYTIRGDLRYWRFGGREGIPGVDMSDLGFVDPSGGPFLAIGSDIEGRTIRRISAENIWVTPFKKQQQILFEVDQSSTSDIKEYHNDSD